MNEFYGDCPCCDHTATLDSILILGHKVRLCNECRKHVEYVLAVEMEIEMKKIYKKVKKRKEGFATQPDVF